MTPWNFTLKNVAASETANCQFVRSKSGQAHLYSSCGESGSCLGWVSVHLSSPSVADCPSEQGETPSERRTGSKKKANYDGQDWKIMPEHFPCGETLSGRHRET